MLMTQGVWREQQQEEREGEGRGEKEEGEGGGEAGVARPSWSEPWGPAEQSRSCPYLSLFLTLPFILHCLMTTFRR